MDTRGTSDLEERRLETRGVAEPDERRLPGRRMIAAFALAAVALVAVPLVVSRIVAQPGGTEYRFEIPDGTAARLADGEQVDVLPAELSFHLADRLVVVNHDSQAHQVGPYKVAPGEVLDRRLSDAGTFSGYCTLHADDRIDIRVAARN